MSADGEHPLSRARLLDYFLEGAAPRSAWKVGMEIEKMGRRAADGAPLPHDGEGPTVRAVLESILEQRGGRPVKEAGRLIGIDAPWGEISLEPGGQVEWSSRPRPDLDALERDLDDHLGALRHAAAVLGVAWLDVAVDPVHPVSAMPWMPKQRYVIMHDYLQHKGRLAHRMMTQTASIQCAFDYADAEDWARKFRAAAYLAPVAVALFANSPRLEGRESGYRCYRQAIWRETDDDRCGLPPIVFEPGFDAGRWLDWVLDVPLLFRRAPGYLLPPDGRSFRQLLEGPTGPDLELEDWATHCSTIFTEVRAYTYVEVRSADLQPDDRAFAVPAFWTGTLYDEAALGAALEAGSGLDQAAWRDGMDSAARSGLEGRLGRFPLRELASRALAAAVAALERGAPCAGSRGATRHLEALASRLALDVRA